MQVILHPFSECVDVKYFNGQKLRSISNPTISHVALDGNHIITVGYDRVVRIWSISTGACLKELKERGHDSPVCAVMLMMVLLQPVTVLDMSLFGVLD